jgi:hypothetical protein
MYRGRAMLINRITKATAVTTKVVTQPASRSAGIVERSR